MESSPLRKWIVIAFACVALIGFLDSAYLFAEHLRGVVPPCTLTNGCEKVLTSQYASVAGVPLAAFGLLYYGTILVLVVACLDTGNPTLFRLAAWLTFGGLAASLYLVSLQLFVLHAICPYCMVSAFTSLALVSIGAWQVLKR